MGSRLEALIERYRTRALDRIRKLSLWLVSLEEGEQGEGLVKDVARELHTLKGDSAVVGMTAVSELAHLAEELLLVASPGDAKGYANAAGQVRKALAVVDVALKAGLSPSSDQSDIHAVRDLLHSFLPELQDRASAPARLQTPGEADAPAATAASPVPATPSAPAAERERPSHPEERWISAKSSHIDKLCDQMIGFIGDFQSLAAGIRHLNNESDASGGTGGLQARELRRQLLETADRCVSKLDDLASATWALRLVPAGPLLEEIVPHATDLARSLGKKVRIKIQAERTEVERGILEALREPVMHLVRNAIDHGIELPQDRAAKSPEATITLRAHPSGANVLISVRDDGKGIDLAAVRSFAVERLRMSPEAAGELSDADAMNLLFVQGFSTRRTVNDISGRGVGLDVVRDTVDALGGRVFVHSTPGQGTTFELSVPSTVGKERAIVVSCGPVLYALPNSQIVELVLLRDYPVHRAEMGDHIRFGSEAIPIRYLASVLQTASEGAAEAVVIIQGDRGRWALIVPTLVGEFDLVRRPIDSLVSRFGHIVASATLDDGRLVLILAANGLIRMAESGRMVRTPSLPRLSAKRHILVVDDSPTVADVVSEILADAGFEVTRATNGDNALASIEASMPDLVLSDVEMPIMGGYELLSRIRSRWANLPVIMLTTRGGSEDRRKASALGANAYLVKSTFEESSLVETVRRFLP